MTNREIYLLMASLGMVDDYHESYDSPEVEPVENVFEHYTCTDIVKTLNFVDDLYLNNDGETIKKFLVALLVNNAKKEGDE